MRAAFLVRTTCRTDDRPGSPRAGTGTHEERAPWTQDDARPSTSSPETVARHWYRDLSIRARIFGLTAVLLLGLVASTVTGLVNGNRASELHAESQAAVAVQQQVEAARYDLLWAANWQNITAWRARVDGGAVAAAPDGDNVAFYTRRRRRASRSCSRSTAALLDAKAQASLDTIQENWTVMSDYNDQIFQLWAAGRSTRATRCPPARSGTSSTCSTRR